MANWGITAGGLSRSLLDTMRFQNEEERLAMQAEREKRLNEMQDMQLEAARKKIAEEQDTAGFETEAPKILAKVGQQNPFTVGGVKFDDREQAQEAANVQGMDNAMEAFAAGKTPDLTPVKVEGGGTFGRQQALSELGALAGQYKNLPDAQNKIREQYARRTSEIIQQAAMMPDREAGVRIMIQALDDIPDGRKVVTRQARGGFEISYVDEATGRTVGAPSTFRSVDDAMLRFAAAQNPESMLKYLQNNVEHQMLGEREQAKQEALLRRLITKGPSGRKTSSGADFESEVDLSKKIQTYVAGAIQDGGETFETPDGEAVLVPKEQLATDASLEAERIRRANPSIPFAEAANIGLSIARTRHGADPAAVDYKPAPQLQSDGSWQMRIRTREGSEFAYPIPVESISPNEVFTQEQALVQRWMDDGVGEQLETRLKDPAARDQLIQYLKQPGAEQVPNLRKAMMLNAYAGVGGDLGVPSIARKRQDIADMRKSFDKPKTEQKTMFSDEDLATAQGQGINPPRDFLGDAASALSKAAGNMRDVADNSTRGVVTRAAERFRQATKSGDQPLIGDLQVLFQGLRDLPELRKEFTEEELTAIQVAAGRRF
ncbi:MAG: hypothetical protein KDC32_14905 [Saprospiraceae bacterium]|nr:hypothetical protein [Saprospiraceae bacterium]